MIDPCDRIFYEACDSLQNTGESLINSKKCHPERSEGSKMFDISKLFEYKISPFGRNDTHQRFPVIYIPFLNFSVAVAPLSRTCFRPMAYCLRIFNDHSMRSRK